MYLPLPYGRMLLFGQLHVSELVSLPCNRLRLISWLSITSIVVRNTVFKNIVTGIFLLGSVYTLLSLGFWQLNRLAWKTEIIKSIEAQEAVDPTTVRLDLSKDVEFQRGYIEGRFLNKPAVQIHPRTNDDGTVGHHVIYPFKTDEGQNIVVNVGWHHGETIHLPPIGKQKITGYLRTPDRKSSFTPANNTNQNQFYSIDIQDLEAFYNVKLFDKVIYLDSAFPTMQKPRNKHAQYAIFWFGMAGLLPLLVLIFIWRRRKACAEEAQS